MGPWTGPAWLGDHHRAKGGWLVTLEIPQTLCGWSGEKAERADFPRRPLERAEEQIGSILFCPLVQCPNKVLCLVSPNCGTKHPLHLLFLFLGSDSLCLDVPVNFKSAILFLNLWLLFSLSYTHSFAYLFSNPTSFD